MPAGDSNMNPTISFLTSNKNKMLLSIDGYVYQKNKTTPKVSYWICENKTCRAGVHLNSDDKFIKFTKYSHNHMPVPERSEVRKVMANIKNRVNEENASIGHIYTEEIARANLSEPALALIPTAKEASRYCSLDYFIIF